MKLLMATYFLLFMKQASIQGHHQASSSCVRCGLAIRMHSQRYAWQIQLLSGDFKYSYHPFVKASPWRYR
jgi:hypothetical protein